MDIAADGLEVLIRLNETWTEVDNLVESNVLEKIILAVTSSKFSVDQNVWVCAIKKTDINFER